MDDPLASAFASLGFGARGACEEPVVNVVVVSLLPNIAALCGLGADLAFSADVEVLASNGRVEGPAPIAAPKTLLTSFAEDLRNPNREVAGFPVLFPTILLRPIPARPMLERRLAFAWKIFWRAALVGCTTNVGLLEIKAPGIISSSPSSSWVFRSVGDPVGSTILRLFPPPSVSSMALIAKAVVLGPGSPDDVGDNSLWSKGAREGLWLAMLALDRRFAAAGVADRDDLFFPRGASPFPTDFLELTSGRRAA